MVGAVGDQQTLEILLEIKLTQEIHGLYQQPMSMLIGMAILISTVLDLQTIDLFVLTRYPVIDLT